MVTLKLRVLVTPQPRHPEMRAQTYVALVWHSGGSGTEWDGVNDFLTPSPSPTRRGGPRGRDQKRQGGPRGRDQKRQGGPRGSDQGINHPAPFNGETSTFFRTFVPAKEDGLTSPFFVAPKGSSGSVSLSVPPHIQAAVEEACLQAGVALIGLQVRGSERLMTMQVTVDAMSGVTHDHCRTVSRSLDERLESDDFYGRLRAVDVSSPGADAPVVFLWQLSKHVGRVVRVKRKDGSVIEGALLRVDDSGLDVQPQGKAKSPLPMITIQSDEVDSANVVLKF